MREMIDGSRDTELKRIKRVMATINKWANDAEYDNEGNAFGGEYCWQAVQVKMIADLIKPKTLFDVLKIFDHLAIRLKLEGDSPAGLYKFLDYLLFDIAKYGTSTTKRINCGSRGYRIEFCRSFD